jgi:3-oxoacyl-ACP reductase-like protein
MGERRGVHTRFFVGKPEVNRPLGNPRPRWEDNIKMDLLIVGCGSMDWINLVQDMVRWRALVYAVTNFLVL